MADTDVTAQTIIDNCIVRRKDTGKRTYTDDELLGYLNKSIDNIQKMLILLESEIAITDGTITMTATQEYELDGNLDDFWAMSREGVYFDADPTPLTPVVYGHKIRNEATTTDALPTKFYLTATHLGLVAIPTATAVAIDNTINCRYYKKPASLTLSGNMPYKNIFNETVAFSIDTMALLRNTHTIENYKAATAMLEQMVLNVVSYRNTTKTKPLEA